MELRVNLPILLMWLTLICYFREEWGVNFREDDREHLYIQMELCGPNSLDHWLMTTEYENRGTDRILNIFKQIIEAVLYIHYKGLIHRDLKVREKLSPNILSTEILGNLLVSALKKRDYNVSVKDFFKFSGVVLFCSNY